MTEAPFWYHFRECQNPDCSFRFPVTEEKYNHSVCPKCGGYAPVCAWAHQFSPEIITGIPGSSIHLTLVLDNLRSIFNVGSIFRSSDGSGIVSDIILCGTTPTPDHPKFSKTALGSEQKIPWRYTANALKVCSALKESGTLIWSLELNENSDNLFTSKPTLVPPLNNHIILVAGNEVAGIDPAILAISDGIYHIPLHGIKESLNVAIAASIAIFYLYQQWVIRS